MADKEVDLRPILPNAVTMTALAFGVSSINMAFWGRWQMAVLFILLAAVFDFLDGKVARIFGVSSRFGAELDSLSDFVSFGVAPGFLMYQWTMDNAMRIEALRDIAEKPNAIGIYWGFVLFTAMCCATRLARFNARLDEKTPPYWTHFFMGVPAPAGAFLSLFPLILWFASEQSISWFRSSAVVGFFLIFSGVMMASRIPTLCLKHIHIQGKYATALMILALLTIASSFAFPWQVCAGLGLIYITTIPVGVYYFLKWKKGYVKK